MPHGNPKRGKSDEDLDQDASTTQSSDSQDPSPDGDTSVEVMNKARKQMKWNLYRIYMIG